jgi:uncharacterized cupin superfamily protein
MKGKAVIDPETVAARTGSIYPPEYGAALAGREKRALGDQFGLSQFGVNLTTMAPGTWSSQRHWHEKEDEFVYVLDGEVTLIDDDGEHPMPAGTCTGFKAGVSNAHHLVNKSSKPALVLEVGTRMAGERGHYAEADMQSIKGDDGKWRIVHKDGRPYD